MTKDFGLFPVSLIGSLPRSKDILYAQRQLRKGNITKKEFDDLVNKETKTVVDFQESLGVDIITSGELGRDNYCSFVCDKLGGVALMSMLELLDYVSDKKAFEQMLDILDVPASSIKNAICIDKLKYNGDIAVSELKLLKSLTNKKVKITLPGPYLLTRSMWLPELSKKAYASKEELGKDVVQILIQEVKNLQAIGVDVIQFDEPVLTEVVFTEGKPRSFMCAALSEKKDPKEELEFAKSLLKPVIDAIDNTKSISSLHVCRGNWSKNEKTLLSGSYTPLLALFKYVNPNQFTLEFSTPRAGDLNSYLKEEDFQKNTILGLGVINPRIDEIEDVKSIVSRAIQVLDVLDKENLWLNPDCGFASFSSRPVNSYDIIADKIKIMKEASKILNDRYK
ncbi:MAG: 5-methyltetrahydropteroyltriglutamate--homocysteine methyltransferase [Lachnospirales bacterium]